MDNKKEVKKDSLFLKAIPYFDKYGILILLLIMIIALHIMQPEVFLSWRNITNVFKQISWQSMLALGVFIVIVTAGIDLSVGSIMMLSLMVLAITSKAGACLVCCNFNSYFHRCIMWNGEWFWNYRTPHATSIYNDFRYSLYF
jgi:ribose transport system permease protein